MNGECIVRLYFLCFGYDCILLFDCRDTRRYARVFWILLVSSFLSFLLCFLFVSLDIKGIIEFLFVTHKTAQLFANIAGDHRTLCHHCQTLTNCLPAWLKTDQLFANQLTLRTSNKFLSPGQIYRNGRLSELLSYIWRVFHTHPLMVQFLSILPQIFWWRFLNASIIYNLHHTQIWQLPNAKDCVAS